MSPQILRAELFLMHLLSREFIYKLLFLGVRTVSGTFSFSAHKRRIYFFDVTNCDLKRKRQKKVMPFVFTEQGKAKLSSVLKSDIEL